MSRRLTLALPFAVVSLMLAPASARLPPSAGGRAEASAAPKDKTAATVEVDCAKGQSINSALAQHPGVQSLVVEVSGLCHENVLVTRDRVTLRGVDPEVDGISAVEDLEESDAALWVRGAQFVTVENLKLTGGFSGLLATGVSVPHLRLLNCRVEGNSSFGVKLELSLLQAVDTTFGPNDGFNVTVFAGSRFECSGCTLSVPSGPTAGRDNVLAFTAAQVLLNDCTLTNGGINAGNSSVLVNDSTVEAFAPGGANLTLVGASTANLTRVQLTGPMRVLQGSNALLGGVTQTPGAFTNQVDESSFVRVGDAPPAAGGPPSIPSTLAGFTLRNFGKASLTQTTTVAGGLNCGSGADAFCQTPANVSGPSNCGLCPKP